MTHLLTAVQFQGQVRLRRGNTSICEDCANGTPRGIHLFSRLLHGQGDSMTRLGMLELDNPSYRALCGYKRCNPILRNSRVNVDYPALENSNRDAKGATVFATVWYSNHISRLIETAVNKWQQKPHNEVKSYDVKGEREMTLVYRGSPQVSLSHCIGACNAWGK